VIKTHRHFSDGPLLRHSFPAAEGGPDRVSRRLTFRWRNDGSKNHSQLSPFFGLQKMGMTAELDEAKLSCHWHFPTNR